MSPEAQRITIAEACGWKPCPRCEDPECSFNIPPDYLNDLGAIQAAEQVIFDSAPGHYERAWFYMLHAVCTGINPSNDGWGDVDGRSCSIAARSTAAQRCETLLRLIRKWKEPTT